MREVCGYEEEIARSTLRKIILYEKLKTVHKLVSNVKTSRDTANYVVANFCNRP